MATLYWIGTGSGSWHDPSKWSESSGGVSCGYAPNATTPVIFDAVAGVGTISIATTDAACASFDCSAITSPISIVSSTVSLYNYGALILNSQLTWTFTLTAYLYLKATSSVALTMNGATVNANRIYFDGVGGTWTNQDAANFGSTSLYLKNGTWNTNNQTITSTGSFVTETGTKVLTLGSSTFNIGVWYDAAPTNFTFNYNTSTVSISTSSISLIREIIFYNLTFVGVGTITAQAYLSYNITVSNILTITGNNSTNYRLLVASSVIGTQRTITVGSLVASNVDFRDIKIVQFNGGLDANEIDNLIIDIDSSSPWGGSDKTLYLKGSCAAPTGASAAAIISLQAKGVTVSTN